MSNTNDAPVWHGPLPSGTSSLVQRMAQAALRRRAESAGTSSQIQRLARQAIQERLERQAAKTVTLPRPALTRLAG